MEEPQYRGIANCASDFADGVNSRRTVYAKPVFAQEALTPEQLPLEEIYNHPDFVDLICAQEFGLEYSTEAGVLVCIAVTATAEALDEIERMICGCVCGKRRTAVCQADGNEIQVQIGRETFYFKCGRSFFADRDRFKKSKAPAAAVVAALAQWCVEYPVEFYWPEAEGK